MELVDRFLEQVKEQAPYSFRGADEKCTIRATKGELYGALLDVIGQSMDRQDKQDKSWGRVKISRHRFEELERKVREIRED